MTETSLQQLQYQILGHSQKGLTEIRIIKEGSKWVKSTEEYEKALEGLLEKSVYVGLNPRRVEKGDAENVTWLTCIVVDVDPVRPRDTPSSDIQLSESLEVGSKITREYPGSFRVSSGNGCHIYFPISPREFDSEGKLAKSIEDWFSVLRDKYGTKTQKIDHIHDAPRIIRVWGSINSKSGRRCEPVDDVITTHRFNSAELLRGAEKPVEVEKKKSDNPELEDRFNRLCMTNPVMHNIVNKLCEYPSRSEADFAFVACLVKAHFSLADISTLILRNPLGKAHERSEKEIKKEVERIHGIIVERGMETVSMLSNRDKYFDGLKDRCMGLKTGFSQFDEMVSGLKPTKVIVFAARPTEGKTTLATQVLSAIAEQGKTCLFFPTEVGAEPIYDKILSRKTGVDLKKFQNGNFTHDELDKISSCKKYLEGLPLVVCEDFALTTKTIERKIKETAPQVVAIDYIQAMKYEGNTIGEVAVEISKNVIKIKEMANVYNIPILLFSQLKRGEGKLDLSMLKGSGSLEEATDIISFLYCADKLVYPRVVDLAVMKSKYSATGIINLKFWSSECRFEESLGHMEKN